MSKKILIHSIAFSPDGVSTAYLYNDIALKFKNEGFDVVVLTTTPHYNAIQNELKKQPLCKKAWGLYSESDFHGIKVKHVYQKKFRSSLLRMLGFIYWHIVSLVLGLTEKNIDYILSPSPPLTIGVVNFFIGKIKKAKVIYNVQEIYPDLLIKEGGLKSKHLIYFLKSMERYVYNKSDKVTTIDQIFYNTIVSRIKDKDKLVIIPNFVDTEIYCPFSPDSLQIDRNLFPVTNSLKIMYAGNIGHAQDWMPLVDLSETLKEYPIEFFVIGEGVMKTYLEKEKVEKCLDNLHIIPYQQRELMPQLLAYSDIQFIFMNKLTEEHGFPSKVYTIMACAKPLLVCSGENTPIINFLKDKNCSFLVTEDDYSKKIEEISNFLKTTNVDDLTQKGMNGYSFIEANYSKSIVTSKYLEVINSL